ncbi:MAG: methionine--tRNA ligase [Deltaproteobacteria bacterium GWA2_45_12]|nr:MAG: methionine--tRNA ligase [Deltaproteobacteria bacterium GWA2_45_12]
MPQFFITTAIDYVNSIPHIGTAYEKIGADILARFHRMLGDEVYFQMGNDEHSVNVKKAAEAQGLAPKAYCDQMRPKFEDVWEKLGIYCDEFIQTSDPKHHQSVSKLFKTIYDNGFIYEGDYEGLYCESCEAFYTEKDLVDNVCPQHKTRPKFIREKNYFFKLSAFDKKLLEHIEKNPQFILPENRRNEIINVIKGGLKDVSVSRAGFDWGIPLPIKPNHVVYVWFDALINYITWIGFADDPQKFKKWWPATLHVIGKDITRFHCVIWPAMLMAANLSLPKTVFGHGFVYLKGEKMSKSLGNVVTPLDVAEKYGPDSLRYYLLRSTSFGDDGNFTWDDFILRYNSDLANGLGNLASRTAGMIARYFSGNMEQAKLAGEDLNLVNRYTQVLDQVKNNLDPWKSGDILFHRALEAIWAWVGEIDRYIDAEAPWTLAKQKNETRLREVLTTVTQCLYYFSCLLKPFIPQTAEKLRVMFGWNDIPFDQLNFESKLPADPIILPQERPSLFPRIEVPK